MSKPPRIVNVEELHVDVAITSDSNPAPQKCYTCQKVPGDFLSPCERIVERVPGEELKEDHDSENPEKNQGHPILWAVFSKVHLWFVARVLVLSLEIGVGVMFLGHTFVAFSFSLGGLTPDGEKDRGSH